MAIQRYPLKFIDLGGGKRRVAEYELGDVVGVNDGGTGSDNSVGALLNLGGIPSALIGVANGICPLDALGYVPSIHIPPLLTVRVYQVANEIARLAITNAQEADEAIQADDGTHCIHDGTVWVKRPFKEIQLLLANGTTLVNL